ncbi:MAG: sigma-54 dependent transcriptional regulator, partial [Candidatus Krumholzibacteria bacterium]|nr:sigma-54 dependent transcriptional regulator [Candidatus Krumholzibacteria bacterium]
MPSSQLLLVALTSDPTIRQVLGEIATRRAWVVRAFETPADLFAALDEGADALLIDDRAAEGGYLAIIKRARRARAAMAVFAVGGPKSEEVRAREREDGVDYYHERPVQPDELRAALDHRLQAAAVKARAGIVGRSAAIEELVSAIVQVAPTEVPILIEGESGTGKDIVARAIHESSRRAGGPFEAINCGALAEGVLESELFGHERGAFTGAQARRAGVFERANGGTIFLDEVGETSPNMQVRLLRVLESGEFFRVGGVAAVTVDVRVVAATNRGLSEAVRRGEFRQDLYYRLKGISLHVSPLRDRPEDIPTLVSHFVGLASAKHGKAVRAVEPAAMRRLVSYRWPGNVRELRNVVDTLVVLAAGPRVTADEVDAQLSTETPEAGVQSLLPVALHRTKDEAEREMIYAAILALHRDV